MIACPSCGADAREGARFCASCGSPIAPGCPRCGVQVPDGARFCSGCGAALAASDAPPQGQERKVVTVLFADVAGSTGLGERLDPERLREVMNAYFAAMRQEIASEGGAVEKFIGDAVMAAFGVPASHEDDPSRALRAALRMRRRLAEVNRDLDASHGVTLEMRVGVNTGEVLAATAPRPGEAMVTGDVVNVAARLQSAAEAGQVLVAERTARAARGFRFSHAAELSVPGRAAPVDALVLMEAAEAPPERGVPGLSAPLVGRDREMDLLRSLYARVAAEGRPHLATIYGEPGVGKSRLVREFLEWAQASDPAPTVRRGRCLPYGEGVTFWPFAEILKEHSGVLDTDPLGDALAKIEATCDAVLAADPSLPVAPTCQALAYTAGLEFPGARMATRDPRQIHAEMHAAWRAFLSALARERPLVVVVEDIHWADTALLDLIDEVGRRVEGPVLILCPARPALLDRRPGWGGGRRDASALALDPLAPGDAERLMSLLLTVEDLPDVTRARILSRAEGNPFFIEEIVRHLVDEGAIVRDGDRWRAGAGIADVEIPDSVQGVLAARIDLLDASDKRALQLAAVVGRVFWPSPVGLLLNGSRDQLGEILRRLEERDLVRPRMGSAVAGETEYIFKHILTREVAYESLPRRERARAHGVVGDWIASSGAEWQEVSELLAHHYGEALSGERADSGTSATRLEELRSLAFEAHLRAGDAARRRLATDRANGLAQQALSLAASPLDRARALQLAGHAAREDCRGNDAWDFFTEAADLRLAHAPDDARAIAAACAMAVDMPSRWPGSMRRLPMREEVLHYLDTGMRCVREEDREERLRLLITRSFLPFYMSLAGHAFTADDIEESRQSGLEGAELALALDRPDLASAALDGAQSGMSTAGLWGAGRRINDRRLELLDRIDDPFERGDIFSVASWHAVVAGDYHDAIRYGRAGAEDNDDRFAATALHAMAWMGIAEFMAGNWDTVARDLMPRVIDGLGDRAESPPSFVSAILGAAGFIHAARGEPGENAARKRLSETQMFGSGYTHELIAWVDAREGRPDDAARRLDAIEAGVQRGVVGWLSHMVAADLVADTGRWHEAPELLERARAYARLAEVKALPAHLDRLEGRAALAAGDTVRAVALLTAASTTLGGLGARWDHARTDLHLAEALLAAGDRDGARACVARALPILEELRPLAELAHARDLASRTG